jgi:Tfp pilus assembly protein PilF
VKGDYRRAEEYYSRAILADPDDGELLSEYAKLVWDVHRDEERASSYFERAAKASPQNSHVLAAHAAFLWDTDDDEEGGGDVLSSYAGFAQPAHSSTLASATT